MAPKKVLLIGAAGETGTSVLNGLLSSGDYTVIALARPGSSSIEKLRARGLETRVASLKDVDALVPILADIDIVLSAISAGSQLDQIPLIDAAKKAGVERFVPCGFIPIIPPGGIAVLRDEKEIVYNHLKIQKLPYTIIDVGWWYQFSFPAPPSGRADYAVGLSQDTIYGDGNSDVAFIDLRSIGTYVARILKDPRTLNKYVFAYDVVETHNKVFKLMEDISGEKIARKHVSEAELLAQIAKAKETVSAHPEDLLAHHGLYILQYAHMWLRGDDSPTYAKYLGYLDARELYPDIPALPLGDYFKAILEGKGERPYPHMKLTA